MEFRAPSAASELNSEAIEYFTSNLSEPEAGRELLEGIMRELGNRITSYPDWHPILTAPPNSSAHDPLYISAIGTYEECDHTREFVRGFITCPYDESAANKLVEAVNKVGSLNAYRTDKPLYSDSTFPVVVEAYEIELEPDGTIRSKDALIWFLQKAIRDAETAQVAETWWNIRSLILGEPHGARSSLLVNQHTGVHMRKILEALNNSGVYGPIKEASLDMLSQRKRDAIAETLIRSALSVWDKKSDRFTFEARGEQCTAYIRDTWNDGYEFSIRVEIGKNDLFVRGFYYEENDRVTFTDPRGKRSIAEKFA